MLEGSVVSAESFEGGFTVTLKGGRRVDARRLLITTGLVDELPDVPGVRERWGRDVLHCPYCHGWEVRDQPIGVLASGPMAVHQTRMGGIMPVYMISTIFSFLPVLILQRRPGSSAFRFTLAGLMCFVAMVVVTRTGNLPINASIEELPTEEAYIEEFGELRQRWTRLHAARNVLNLAGLVFTSLGALSESRTR